MAFSYFPIHLYMIPKLLKTYALNSEIESLYEDLSYSISKATHRAYS